MLLLNDKFFFNIIQKMSSTRIDDGSSKVPLKSTAAALIPSLEE